MRYRVIKVENGLGEEKWAIQYKDFLTWKVYRKTSEYDPSTTFIDLYNSYEEAKETIDEWIREEKSEKFKVIKVYK